MEELIKLLNQAAAEIEEASTVTLSENKADDLRILAHKLFDKAQDLDGKVIYEP